MGSRRGYVALLAVAPTPGVFLCWFSIHLAHIVLLAVAEFFLPQPILAVEFGTQPTLVGAAVAGLVISVVVCVQIHRVFKSRLLNGLPELAPDEYESRLVTTGTYAHVRHPRYG